MNILNRIFGTKPEASAALSGFGLEELRAIRCTADAEIKEKLATIRADWERRIGKYYKENEYQKIFIAGSLARLDGSTEYIGVSLRVTGNYVFLNNDWCASVDDSYNGSSGWVEIGCEDFLNDLVLCQEVLNRTRGIVK